MTRRFQAENRAETMGQASWRIRVIQSYNYNADRVVLEVIHRAESTAREQFTTYPLGHGQRIEIQQRDAGAARYRGVGRR